MSEHRSRYIETLLAALAVALTLWIVGTTINISRTGWVAIPTVDDWDRWILYLQDHYSLTWFFRQHFDHRLAAPKLLFVVDHLVFHARGWFLLVCAYCFQAVTGIILWWFSGRACQQSRTERVMQAAALACCLFSGQQWVNFVMPFQVQFPMVYCAAAATVFAIWKSSEHWSLSWMTASIVLAGVATYSMINGVLIWPVMLLAGVWLGMPRRWIMAIAMSGALIGGSYFYSWHRWFPPVEMAFLERLWRAMLFGFTHMGVPAAPYPISRDSHDLSFMVAAVTGALLATGFVIAFVMLWRRRERYNNAQAMLVFYSAFMAATFASIAYGRSGGPRSEAFEWRYFTPPYIFWSCMLLIGWPLLRRIPRAALYSVMCAAMLEGIAVNQGSLLETVKWWSEVIRQDEAAVADNVTDPEIWKELYYASDGPQMIRIMDTIDYLRNNNLTIFTEDWTHWPGIALDRRFSVDGTPGACQGRFEQVLPMAASFRPGWRATGWAWDNKAGRAPRYVVLVDYRGMVAGVALTKFFRPPGRAALPPQYKDATWIGYVNGKPRPITAYLVEADGRRVCAIGTQKLRSGPEVSFTELGPGLPESTPDISGAWGRDGYYKGPDGPGAPPCGGAVFGSFPDANTGSIRWGPFHLDGDTEIAIPVVTGPDSHNLSIVVRDAASKEVLAQMAPPPMRVAWWAWHPDLPSGGKIDVEVLAEDKGSGWGQWLALGWPHVLRP